MKSQWQLVVSFCCLLCLNACWTYLPNNPGETSPFSGTNETEPTPTPEPGNFQMGVGGAKRAYAGHSLYVTFFGTRTAGVQDHVYVTVTGLPEGVTASFPDIEKTCCGSGDGLFLWSVAQDFYTSVKLSFPSGFASGNYTIWLRARSNGVSQGFPFTITVRGAPAPVVKEPYKDFGDAPALSQYDQHMVQYGLSELCDQQKVETNGLWEGNSWYYDGTRVAYQIAEYTQDETFKTCALYPLGVYRPYVVGNNGSVPGWRNFAAGFRIDYEERGDETSKEAVVDLINASYGPNGTLTSPLISEGLSREVAYAIDTMLESEKVGQPRHPRLPEYVDFAFGHIEQWFVTGRYQRMAPFMFALTSEALIRYYEATNDPRVLPALKTGADWIWEHAWVASDRSFCYEYLPSVAGNNCTAGAPDLNLLIVPVYGWIYAQTGDSTYITKGDQIFSGGVEGAWLAQGKQFSQNYRWSMEYLKWRDQRQD